MELYGNNRGHQSRNSFPLPLLMFLTGFLKFPILTVIYPPGQMPKTAAVIKNNNYQWKRQAKHWMENKLKIILTRQQICTQDCKEITVKI